MAKPEEEAPKEEADSKPKGKKKGAHEDAEDPAGQEVEESAHQNGEDEAAGDESLSQ